MISRVCAICDELSQAAQAHPQLSQLLFCLKLYLHLGEGGSLNTHTRDMQEPDRSSVRLCAGVRLAPRPKEPRVALGGHTLKGTVLVDGTKLAMVAVKAKVDGVDGAAPTYTIWYGQLVLCFEALYLGRWRQLCYVRWLDRPSPVVQTIAATTGPRGRPRPASAAEYAYLREMRSAPFAAYRWSRATGSTRSGHPAAGDAHYGVISAEHVLYRVPMVPLFRHTTTETDPTFFLNTDMWDL